MGGARKPVAQKGNGEEQGMTVKVTVEDVERVAELAHLQLRGGDPAHVA